MYYWFSQYRYLKLNTYLSYNVECVKNAFEITIKNDNDYDDS